MSSVECSSQTLLLVYIYRLSFSLVHVFTFRPFFHILGQAATLGRNVFRDGDGISHGSQSTTTPINALDNVSECSFIVILNY